VGDQLRGSPEGQQRLAERAAEKAAAERAAAEEAELQRDHEALVRMVAAYHDDLARVAFVVSGLSGLAQDAARAAWAKVWQARASMRNPDRLQARLLGFAANEARSLASAGAGSRQDAIGESGAPTTQAASAPAYRSDELALANTLAEIDILDRQILALRWIGNLDADQIGIELGMPGSAVLARVARILDRLTKDARFPAAPDETIDEFERGLALRIHSLTDRAVAPVDAAEVAQTAIDTVPEPSSTERLDALLQTLIERARALDRRAWLAIGGVAVAVLAIALLGGGRGGVAVVTPIPTDATRLCTPAEVEARITAWTPDQETRVATVEIKNTSAGACLLEALSEPWFTDRTHTPLITGIDHDAGSIRIGPGDTLRTKVHVGNYCGAAPQPPITFAFRQRTDVISVAPLEGSGAAGVPPCTNPSAGAGIFMEQWAP
jgi:DNA-directed RNA polymerase specialized sigma24 family protein